MEALHFLLYFAVNLNLVLNKIKFISKKSERKKEKQEHRRGVLQTEETAMCKGPYMNHSKQSQGHCRGHCGWNAEAKGRGLGREQARRAQESNLVSFPLCQWTLKAPRSPQLEMKSDILTRYGNTTSVVEWVSYPPQDDSPLPSVAE